MVKKISQRKQVFELPKGGLFVTEYQLYKGHCANCKKRHRGTLPAGVPRGILGPSLLAKIGSLTGKYRLSKRNVKEFLWDFFGLNISVGTISNAEKQVSDALKDPVEAIGQQIGKQTNLHADETSYPYRGELEWLWVATNQLFTYFKLYPHRNQSCAQALIGPHFSGMLITDRYGAYNWIPSSQRQYCWAHLKRDFKKIADRPDEAEAAIGDELLNQLQSIFVTIQPCFA